MRFLDFGANEAPFLMPMILAIFQAHVVEPLCRGRTRAGRTALVALLLGAPARAQEPSDIRVTLGSLLDSVHRGHPHVQAANARVRAALGARTTAGLLGNPILGYEVVNTPFPGGRPLAGIEREAMTTATVPLEPLYLRSTRVARANADVRAMEGEAVAAGQRIALGATKAFYRVAIAQVAVATGRDLSTWLDSVVTYNRARVKEGVTSEADLIRSGLERDRAAADATMSEAELVQARADLSGFLPSVQRLDGRRLVVVTDDLPLSLSAMKMRRSVREVADRLADSLLFARSDSVLALQAMATRSEVRTAREHLSAANANVATEQRMRIRQLGATIGTKQTVGTISMVAGISFPVPLFDVNRGEVQRASGERDAASFEVANQERIVASEVLGASEAARLLTERMALLNRRDPDTFLARADEGRRIALGAYREGAVPLFQVIDAARTWGDARLTYYRTLFAQHQSVIALIAAEGGDLFFAHSSVSAR